MKKIALIGIKGLPARYGGFETCADNLIKNQESTNKWYVFGERIDNSYLQDYKVEGIRVPLNANGPLSLLHDALGILYASFFLKVDTLLLLGYSGAFILPFVKMVCRVKVVTNIDGLEWRRTKHSCPTRQLLRCLEFIAKTFSDVIIIDNEALKDYLSRRALNKTVVIAYGGDHTMVEGTNVVDVLPENISSYYLSLSRIEPENNVEIILDTFVNLKENIVYIGNWSNSNYGKALKAQYSHYDNIILLDAIYDLTILAVLRKETKGYIHGHSVGGTNPALVESLFHTDKILAFDCSFNRATLRNTGSYWQDGEQLKSLINGSFDTVQPGLLNLYLWKKIAKAYNSVL